MSQNKLFVENFFATPIFYGAVEDINFQTRLLELVEECESRGWFKQEVSTTTEEYSKKQSIIDNDTTASTVHHQPIEDILHDYTDVKDVIVKYTEAYLDNIETPERDLEVSASWLHRAGKNDTVGWHHHGYTTNRISGVYYIKTTGGFNGGRTLFRTPNPYDSSFTNLGQKTFQPVVGFRPKERNMLMWPSWLQHRTTPNYDGDPRIIMSFNIDIKYHHER